MLRLKITAIIVVKTKNDLSGFKSPSLAALKQGQRDGTVQWLRGKVVGAFESCLFSGPILGAAGFQEWFLHLSLYPPLQVNKLQFKRSVICIGHKQVSRRTNELRMSSRSIYVTCASA